MRGLDTLWEGVAIALEGLRSNVVRSGLTILGVAVGVSVVVVVAALITGIRTTLEEGFEAAGPENFIVTRIDFTAVRLVTMGGERPPWWGRPEIEPREAEAIASLPGVREALFNFQFAVTADYEGESISGIQAQGYSAGWPVYTPGDFVAGRDFTHAEVRQSRPVVVISRGLAGELFGQRDPLGRRVGFGSPWRSVREEFIVVGVFEQAENPFSEFVDLWALFPYTAATKRLRADDSQAQIFVVPADGVSQAAAMDDVVTWMRSSRGLGPRAENDFSLLRSAQIMEIFNQLTAVFFLVMLALSSVGLLVGGVGVIGIMLISVTERTREIGIRKAMGATRREILWQFLVEASVLTVLGGAAGMALGTGAAEAVERLSPIPAAIPLWSVVAALGMAVVTGILFGLLPAYRASRMEPTEALRYE